jgi:hypothetical protein
MLAKRNLMTLYLGILLLAWGVIFLVEQFLGTSFWSYFWPFFVILTGAAFFVCMRAGGQRLSGLAIPGSVISMIGLILLVQNTFHQWQTWSYAWSLIVVSVGIGLVIHSNYGGIAGRGARRAGLYLVRLGLILFLAFGIFFELLFFLLGEHHASAIFWSVALIAVGVYIIFARGGGIFHSQASRLAFQTTDGGQTTSSGVSPVGSELPAGGAQSMGAGPQTTGVNLTGAFNRISNRGLGNLHLAQGEAEDLRIKGSEELKAHVRTEVKDGTLEIRFEHDWLDWLTWGLIGAWKLDYYLTMRDINGIALRGAGNLECAKIETTDLELSQAGAGNVAIASLSATELKIKHSGAGNLAVKSLAVEVLSVEQSGVGNIELSGRATRQDVHLSGAGNYSASRLESQDVLIRQSGLGNASVWAAGTLEASLSGAGNIEYRGAPALTQKVSGLGSVKNIG